MKTSLNFKTLTRRLNSKRAFTLIELMVVIVILGTLMTILFVSIPENPTGDLQLQAKKRQIEAALFRFETQCGRLPTTDEGLSVLVEPPADIEKCQGKSFLKTAMIQNGNNCVFSYELDENSEYKVKDLGKDCQEGGEGKNADTPFDSI